MENDSEVLSGLVVKRTRDGRCRYDPQIKQELVRRALQPGVSVAKLAMQHGVNANLLRKWINQRQHRSALAVQQTTSEMAPQNSPDFLAVRLSGAPNAATAVSKKAPTAPSKAPAQSMQLHVQLPNGIAVDLGTNEMQDLRAVMQTLCSLSCSR